MTLGLRLTGNCVIHIGECATPTLHRAVLVFGKRAGCMITASRNPVSDSGIKVFDTFGYKSNRDYEADVSQTVRQLAEEDRDVDVVDREALSKPDEDRPQWSETAHRTWLAERWGRFNPCLALGPMLTRNGSLLRSSSTAPTVSAPRG